MLCVTGSVYHYLLFVQRAGLVMLVSLVIHCVSMHVVDVTSDYLSIREVVLVASCFIHISGIILLAFKERYVTVNSGCMVVASSG